MGELLFRPMEDDQVTVVVDLWKNCGLIAPQNDPFRDLALARGKASSDVLVGMLDETLVSAIMVGHDGHRGSFYYVAVAPRFQRRGHGAATVRAGEAWLAERGVWKVNLLVRNQNAAVKNFYERLGYVIDPVFSMGRRFIAASPQ
ncbi:MAG: GNAT family acetyltransferase [Pseudomonadota bacterium]|nr:GNAT family acetyltransferase [Pseudomonadota bacterium]